MQKSILQNRYDALEGLKTVMWPTCSQCFLEGRKLGGIGHMYSLCHPTDFSVIIPKIDLASFAWQAGGMECFYLTFGKVYDLDVACFMSFPF